MTWLAAIFLFAQTVVPEVRTAADSCFKSANAAPEAHKLAGIYRQAGFIDEFAHVAITDDLQIAFERHGNSGSSRQMSARLKSIVTIWMLPGNTPKNIPSIRQSIGAWY